MNNGGAVNDSSGGRSLNNSRDIRVELLVKLKSFLYLGIGTGNRYLSFMDGRLVYEFGDWDRYYAMQPTVKLEVIPLFASLLLQGDIASWVRVYLTGGVGAYFGFVEADAVWKVVPTFPLGLIRQSKYSTDTRTLAYHLGSGVDVSLGEVFRLHLEVLYNPLTFSNFDDMKVETRTGQWNPIIPETGKRVFPAEFVYEISELSFSGLSLNVGIGVGF